METTKTLVEIAKDYGIKKDRVNLLESQVKKLKKEIQEQEAVLFGMFEDSELASIKSGGRTYFSRTDTYASVDSGNAEAAFEWVRGAGYEDIVKLSINARSLTAAIKDIKEQTGETPGDDSGINIRTINRIGVRS